MILLEGGFLLFTQGSIGHRMVYEAVIGDFSYGFSLKVLLFFSLSSLSFPVQESGIVPTVTGLRLLGISFFVAPSTTAAVQSCPLL